MTHTVGALETTAKNLVGVLSDVADRLLRGHCDGEDRCGVGVLLLDRRLQDRARQLRQNAVDAVADFLRGDVRILLEPEGHDDLRDAFSGVRIELIDAADGVDRFLDLVGDLALDLLRRSTGETCRDRHRREVHLRQSIDSKLAKGKCADDDEREDQNRCEDRPTDTEFSKPLHDAPTSRRPGRRRPTAQRYSSRPFRQPSAHW